MTTNVAVRRLVATSLSAMWHLDSVFKEMMGRGEVSYSPGLIIAHVCMWLLAVVHKPWWMVVGWSWFIFICGRLSSLVGGRLRLLGGHGSGVDVSCGWHWALCRGCRWQHRWVVVGGWLKKGMDVTHCDIWIMFKFAREIITCMISRDHLGLVPWKSTGCSTDFFFFSRNRVRLCMELQDITIQTQFPSYSMQIPPECQIP